MRIAVDLSVLQTDNRFRGVGSVVINFINHLSNSAKKENHFIFFIEKNNESIIYELLKLDNINFETRLLHTKHYIHLNGKINLPVKAFYKIIGLIEYCTGDPRILKHQLDDVDAYIQFDQNQKLPKSSSKKAFLFIHDIIPYILESDYLWTYKTARLNGRSFKSSLKCAFLRYQYITRVRISCRRAKHLIANSKNTKNDFIKYIKVSKSKISIALLGVNNDDILSNEIPELYSYKTTIWGPVRHKLDLSVKPFILFIGGIDPRRQMVELLASYNNLRARGTDISLVLSGDAMDGLENLKNEKMKKYLKNNSSYSDDIHLMGYTTNDERDWLYRNALAFIFPSTYEGFGLPVLEAMSHGTPVITYRNTSILEVGGKNVLYVDGFIGITTAIQQLIDTPSQCKILSKKGIVGSSKFTWDRTANTIINVLYNQK